MPSFNLSQLFAISSPRMITLAALYPLRSVIDVVSSCQPDLKGLKRWQAVLDEVKKPARPPLPPYDVFEKTGEIKKFITTEKVLLVRGEHNTLHIRPLASNLALIRARQDGAFPEPFSYSVEKSPDQFDAPTLTVEETTDHLRVRLERFTLEVARDTGQVTLIDPEGWALFQGRGVGWHEEGQTAWQAQFDADNAFYGLGEKASELDHAGKRFELWNTDPSAYSRGDDPIYMSVPFLLALHDGQAVGLFFDNSHRSWIAAGAEEPGMVEYRVLDDEFRLYVMVGTPAEVMETYTEIAGRINLPPLWALGFHQSRWSYYPQERVLEIARQFRARSLPADVIHLDIHYMDDYRCFTWNRSRFPEPSAMINQMHQMGFKALSMIDPGIKVDPGYFVYDEGIENDYFIQYPDGKPFTGPVWPGDCHFPDFTNPEVREWWGGLYEPLLDYGLDAFWNDMNEIAIIARGPRGVWVPDEVVHQREEQETVTHDEIHNVYGMLMVKASTEGLRRLRPNRRPLILSRSGWAGLQRHAMHWTGDNHSTWDDLHLSIQMALNLGFSGIPFTGPDLGGFTGGPTPELYARWMQVGAFTPFMRAHSMVGSPDQEPWAFGAEVEAISRKYLELRYRLLPYHYTAMWQAAQTGAPVMRSLSFAFPDDALTYSLDDQFLFGPDLLVAPILHEGDRSRSVYLPEGAWFDWWTAQTHNGPITTAAEAPLDHLPLYVRGGAVIPLWPVQQYVGEKSLEILTLRVYVVPGEHTSTLYEDDGLTPDYQFPDKHRLSTFTVKADATLRDLTISREIEYGTYAPGYQQVEVHIAGLPGKPSTVTCEGGEVQSSRWVGGWQVVNFEAAKAFTLHLTA